MWDTGPVEMKKHNTSLQNIWSGKLSCVFKYNFREMQVLSFLIHLSTEKTKIILSRYYFEVLKCFSAAQAISLGV